jgi:hypothetical protein
VKLAHGRIRIGLRASNFLRVFAARVAHACTWPLIDETTTAGPGVAGTGRELVFRWIGAEGVGFEPTSKDHLLAVFKTAAIGH